MKLTKLLKFQCVYSMMGILYNIVSYIIVVSGGQQLSTTNPLLGACSMAVYGIMLLTGYFGHIGLYRILMFIAIVGFGYGGIIIHFIKYFQQPSLYGSFIAWVLAVGINVFVLYLNILAAAGKFEAKRSTNR